MGWKENLEREHPEHAQLLRETRLRDADIHYNMALESEKRGDYRGARACYFKFVESVRQYNELNNKQYDFLYEEAKNGYFKFVVERDPVYKELLNKILPVIRENEGVLQTELYNLIPTITKEDISYVLYFADKAAVIKRIKKGRTYEIIAESS